MKKYCIYILAFTLFLTSCSTLKINKDLIGQIYAKKQYTYKIQVKIVIIKGVILSAKPDPETEKLLSVKMNDLIKNQTKYKFIEAEMYADAKYQDLISILFKNIDKKNIATNEISVELLNQFKLKDKYLLLIRYSGGYSSKGVGVAKFIAGVLSGKISTYSTSAIEYCIIDTETRKIVLYNAKTLENHNPKKESTMKKHLNSLILTLEQATSKNTF